MKGLSEDEIETVKQKSSDRVSDSASQAAF